MPNKLKLYLSFELILRYRLCPLYSDCCLWRPSIYWLDYVWQGSGGIPFVGTCDVIEVFE